MARWGEGDPRWLVENRNDGRNVNQWHWEEFNKIDWAKNRLSELLVGFSNELAIISYQDSLESRSPPMQMQGLQSGAVMGFLLSGCGLFVIYIVVLIYKLVFGSKDYEGLFNAITGGGIYTKAADVGADLASKVEENIPEDDARNPAVIADNVGDNVGDIVGMGADLFGSFAESTCAALVVSSLSSFADGEDQDWLAMLFPLMISAFGIFVCIITTLVATDFFPAKSINQIESTLKIQLILSTALMTPVAYFVAVIALPDKFTIPDPMESHGEISVKNWHMFICVSIGLWGGLFIGIITEYFTSNRYAQVQDVADSCRTGAATNVIFGLALGYRSCIVPCVLIAASIYTSFKLAGMYGIACAALGMLTTLSTSLAIDAYGLISDNAGGIAEMAGMGSEIRERTDALDSAGNTTAAIGKGFAIGSAALISLALFGAYVTRAGINVKDASILDPKVFVGLFLGAMLPYWFSAMTMKSVGKAALAMVNEVRRQFQNEAIRTGAEKPDYRSCVMISM
eukprot:g8580.t1